MFRSIQRIFESYGPFVILEIAVIWACVYLLLRFLRGTRGAGIIKGFAVLVVTVTLLFKALGRGEALGRLSFIYDHLVSLAAILLIVVFQPELRQFMIRLGHARWLRPSTTQVNQVVDAVSGAVEMLSRNQFGALIAIERSVGLSGLFEGGEGERLDALVSARMLGSIFWPNSPLHDLGVVIRGNRILAANVQFPLSEEGSVPKHHGSRHRAAVGITLESDCIAVVVSEETGSIALVEQGVVEANVPRSRFRERLQARLEGPPGGRAGDGGSDRSSEEPVRRPKLKKKLKSVAMGAERPAAKTALPKEA